MYLIFYTVGKCLQEFPDFTLSASATGERIPSSLWVLQSLWKFSDWSDLGQVPVPEPISIGMGGE